MLDHECLYQHTSHRCRWHNSTKSWLSTSVERGDEDPHLVDIVFFILRQGGEKQTVTWPTADAALRCLHLVAQVTEVGLKRKWDGLCSSNPFKSYYDDSAPSTVDTFETERAQAFRDFLESTDFFPSAARKRSNELAWCLFCSHQHIPSCFALCH